MIRARNQKDIEYRRSSIMEAAEQLFNEHFYDSITLDMIASVVQLSKRTLYLYYSNKNAIYHELFLRQSQERLNYYKQELEKCSGGFNAVRTFGVANYEYFARYTDRHRLVLHFDILPIWQAPAPDNEHLQKLIAEFHGATKVNRDFIFNELKKDFENGLTNFTHEDQICASVDQLFVTIRTIYNRSRLMGEEPCCRDYYYWFLELFINGIRMHKN